MSQHYESTPTNIIKKKIPWSYYNIILQYYSLNESECGGGPGTGGENSPESGGNHPVSSSSMGMQFGSLWGGTNGSDMLANMYTNDNSNAEHDEEMEEHVTSDASNDSNSNMQGGLTAATGAVAAAAVAGSD